MKALSLFSGIGGIDLACEWAGIETVAFCEWESFPQKVLKKHWPNVPIYGDVRDLTKERLEVDGIDTGAIGLIHGGYPCQPFSFAGEREGEGDDRHLWPEIKRLLEGIRPRWFVGENVFGHVSLGLDNVLADLEDIGYTARALIIPACGVGALHKRDRVFIVAHSNGDRLEKDVCNELLRKQANYEGNSGYASAISRQTEWQGEVRPEPELCGVVNGFPNRVDRFKSLGNAVVPQQIYPILAAIKQIDDALGGSNANKNK